MVAAAFAKALVALWPGPSTLAAPAAASQQGFPLGVPPGPFPLVGGQVFGGRKEGEEQHGALCHRAPDALHKKAPAEAGAVSGS